MVSYLCTALAVSLDALPLTQYTNFTHGLPFQSSSSANTAVWKLAELQAHVCSLHWRGLWSRDFGCCEMALDHWKTKKTRPINQGTALCLWSHYNLLGMAGFFSFQSEGISVSLDDESKQPSKAACELSRIWLLWNIFFLIHLPNSEG